jgi:hypothetical protein
MPKKTASKKRSAAVKKPGVIEKVRLSPASARPITVKHLDAPPTIPRPKKIHPRHLLPLVREGEERNIHSVSRETALLPRVLAPLAATDEITLAKNTELTAPAKQRTASNVGEPSVAINGDVVFFTGNWYAAVSSDGGTTFKFIDPGTQFPNPSPNVQFCCDQIVHYISKIDTFVWLLQYGPEAGDNIQRLAFAKTADVVKGKWRLFDITTKSLKVPGAFMDFPDLSVGANNLYVTTNIFGPGNQFGSAVIRIPFSGIVSLSSRRIYRVFAWPRTAERLRSLPRIRTQVRSRCFRGRKVKARRLRSRSGWRGGLAAMGTSLDSPMAADGWIARTLALLERRWLRRNYGSHGPSTALQISGLNHSYRLHGLIPRTLRCWRTSMSSIRPRQFATELCLRIPTTKLASPT